MYAQLNNFDQSYANFHQNQKYQSRWSSAFDRFNHQTLWQKIHEAIQNPSANILEIGCAHGASLNEMHAGRLGAGIDIRFSRLCDARENYPRLSFIQSNSFPLPFKDGSFDLVFQFVTFSSIKDTNLKKNIASEILRVLKPGGLFLWYDFRYPNPFNPFTTFESRQKIHQYFPGLDLHLETMTVIPQLGRIIYPRFKRLFRLLDKIRLMHSHYFGKIIKAVEE